MTEKLIRYPDWEARLSAYLDRVSEDRFKWGKHDCALFAADCVKAMTGVDPAADFRDQYDTARGAAEALRDYGAGTLLKTMKAWFGQPIDSIHQAKRGDLVMMNRMTVGVCVGQYSWFIASVETESGGVGHQGLQPSPTRDCRYAFSIPFAAEGDHLE